MDNYLEHHGILGMKWGVRRFQNPDGSLTALGKSRLKKFSSSYSEADSSLKKGQKFQRVGDEHEEDNEKRTYVSYTKADNALYLQQAGEGLAGWYKLELDAIDDIKIAKGKTFAESFAELYGSHTADEFAKNYSLEAPDHPNRFEKKELEERAKIFKDAFKDQASFDKALQRFSKDLMNDSPLNEELFSLLSRKGYDALTDMNDTIGDSGGYEDPLIILNRKKSLMTKKVSEITSWDQELAADWLDSIGFFD